MHPSTAAAIRTPRARTGWPRSVWIVISLLLATVAALGATLAWQSRAPAEPPVPIALAGGPAESGMPPAAAQPSTQPDRPAEAPAAPAVVPAHKPAPVAAAPVATKAPAPAPRAPSTTTSEPGTPVPTRPAVVSVCNSCGIVEAVEPVQRQGKATGLGAVAGGVVGGALGNRMGAGSGKTAMTVLGAVGGGFAGNAIEKRARSETVYRVKVRMEDGSLRTLTQAQTVAVGTRVTVNGETLKVTAPSGSSKAGDGSSA